MNPKLLITLLLSAPLWGQTSQPPYVNQHRACKFGDGLTIKEAKCIDGMWYPVSPPTKPYDLTLECKAIPWGWSPTDHGYSLLLHVDGFPDGMYCWEPSSAGQAATPDTVILSGTTHLLKLMEPCAEPLGIGGHIYYWGKDGEYETQDSCLKSLAAALPEEDRWDR